MALFLLRRIKKSDQSVDVLLVSSTTKKMVEDTMLAIYPDYDCEVPEEDPELIEQLFNEQYGGIAILQTV